MAATTQPPTPVGDAHPIRASAAPATSAVPGPDVQSTIDATHASLDAYLNQPVRDILARLGLDVPAAAASSTSPAGPSANSAPGGGPGSGGDAPGGGGSPIDPTQMIKPVTDALGTLGSGQYGDTDPTQSLGGMSQALDSAGSQVQQALSGLGSDWQGDASSAAQATTQAALADGAKASEQATGLKENLATATAAVAQAQARLIQIIDEYWAKIAAIGPSIIFPWGIAAAIAAATEAVTETSEVMTETESILTTQAAGVTALGAPIDVTEAPLLGSGAGAFSPMMQLASTATSPVMQAIGAATGAAGGSAGAPAAASTALPTGASSSAAAGAAGGGGAAAGGRGVGAAALTAPLRSAAVATVAAPGHTAGAASVQAAAAKSAGMAGGGTPMGGGGAGMAHPSAKAGATGHNAADFLHTSDQGGEILGDPGDVAPPVIGEKDPMTIPATGR